MTGRSKKLRENRIGRFTFLRRLLIMNFQNTQGTDELLFKYPVAFRV